MGQQQLLLVILVTILVGIATVVAINVFGSAAENANRDAVRQDLLQAAAGAQAVWSKPVLLGGAGRNFSEIGGDDGGTLTDADILQLLGIPGSLGRDADDENDVITNENGTYRLGARSQDEITIIGEPSTYLATIEVEVERTDDGLWEIEISETAD